MNPVPHDPMSPLIAEADLMIYTPLPDIHMDIALSTKILLVTQSDCNLSTTYLSFTWP